MTWYRKLLDVGWVSALKCGNLLGRHLLLVRALGNLVGICLLAFMIY